MRGSKPKTRNVRIFLDGDDTERGISRREDGDESIQKTETKNESVITIKQD